MEMFGLGAGAKSAIFVNEMELCIKTIVFNISPYFWTK